EAHPEGKLFRNAHGTPWNRYSVSNRFARLGLSLGMARLKELGVAVPPLPRFNSRHLADKAALGAAREEHRKKLRERRKQVAKLAREHGLDHCLYNARHGFAQRL